MSTELEISAQLTPNPNTLKFMINMELLESGSLDFPNKDRAEGSVLPTELFKNDDVAGVFVGKNFVSITKKEDSEWSKMVEPLINDLKRIISENDILVNPDIEVPESNDTEIESTIKRILDTEIRPAVAMDGGDIQFHSYQDGILTLHLQGACSSCPSATMTLKMGVESRLKEEIPELREVIQI